MQQYHTRIYSKKFPKMTQKTHFGLKIKQLIDARGETLEEAAKRVNGTKSNLSKILKKEDVNTLLLRQFGEAYGVGLGYFFRDLNQYAQNSQNTGFQAIGKKIINYEAVGQKRGTSIKDAAQAEILAERLQACENEKKLLREMVDLLKSK